MSSKLMSELLSSAQTHIPALGFTLQAIQAGARQTGQVPPSIVAELFPNPTHTSQSLLQQFDRDHFHNYSRQHLQRNLRSKEDQKKAYIEAVAILEDKLKASQIVKARLPDALASLLSSTLPFIPVSVPNPSPLLQRAHSIADEALHLTGWTGHLSTDWYTRRISLSTVFMISELHMISPDQQISPDITQSLALYRRLTSVAAVDKEIRQAKMQGDFPDLKQWADWGTRGWIGILRSYGL